MCISAWSSAVCSSYLVLQLPVERPGDVNHLLQLAHRPPQLLPFDVDCGIVLVKLALARGEPLEDRLDVPLRRGIAVERALQLELGRASCRARVCQSV